jgi:hypothetical protein
MIDPLTHTPQEWRHMAADSLGRRAESEKRCDTDGFASQFSNGLAANLYELAAEVAENDGMSEFPVLKHGDKVISRREIAGNYGGYSWLLEQPIGGRRFVPTGKNSRIQKQLGLHEDKELASAIVKYAGGGNGFSGLATVYTTVERRYLND